MTTAYRSGYAFYSHGISSIDKLVESLPDGMGIDSAPWLNHEHHPSTEEIIMSEQHIEHDNTTDYRDPAFVSFKDLENEDDLRGIDPDCVSHNAALELMNIGADISPRNARALLGRKVTVADVSKLVQLMREGPSPEQERVTEELKTLVLNDAIVSGIERALDGAAWRLVSDCQFMKNIVFGSFGERPEAITPAEVNLFVQQCLAYDQHYTNMSATNGDRRDLRGSASGQERKVLSDRQFELLFGATDAGSEGNDRDPVADRIIDSLHIIKAFTTAGFQVSSTREELCDQAHQRAVRTWMERRTTEENRKLKHQVDTAKAAESMDIGW